MSFQYPWAFLLLIAIPILIIIYILKNKYKEETVSSSYIWNLSKQFLKKRNPINTFSKLLALILQCCAILFFTVSLAKPVLSFSQGANNIVFVLDSSASMAMSKDENQTKFEYAKAQIKDIAGKATKGSTFSLISSTSNSWQVCNQIDDVDVFTNFVDSVQIDEANSDLDTAMSLAQTLVSQNKADTCYIATDQSVVIAKDNNGNDPTNLHLIDASNLQDNYAITNVEYTYVAASSSNHYLELDITYISYVNDAILDFTYDIDGDAFTISSTTGVKAVAGVESKISVNVEDKLNEDTATYKYQYFDTLTVKIANEDGLMEDNVYTIYHNMSSDYTNILLVSSTPLYLQAAFRSLNNNGVNINLQVLAPSAYSNLVNKPVGWDIYVFDCYSPDELPTGGSVWLINTDQTIEGTGFYAQKEYTKDDPGITLSYTEATSDDLYNQLTQNLVKRDIVLNTYMRYTLNNRYTTILSYDNIPMVFAGKNDKGQRQIVMSFDLHNSDLPLLADFITLLKNFINYSNPSILTKFNYQASDSLSLILPDNTVDVTITTPSEGIDHTGTNEIESYKLEEVGTYTVVVKSVYSSKTFKVYVSYPLDERNPKQADTKTRSIVANSQEVRADAIYDDILPFIIVAVVFFLTDWILYGHEQF